MELTLISITGKGFTGFIQRMDQNSRIFFIM